MGKKIISHTLLILFILALAAVPVLLIFLPTNAKKQQETLQHDNQLLARLKQLELSSTPTSSPTPTPLTKVPPPLPSVTVKTKPTIIKPLITETITPKPTFVASIIQEKEITDWKQYKSNNTIASSFSFSYPSSWNVRYKNDDSQESAYQFMFVQSSGNQIMTIQLYPSAASAEDFISQNYKNKLVSEVFTEIGKKTLYRVSPKDNVPASDPVYTVFGSRGLILAKQHAYTISFDTNSDHAMINLIEQIIWPQLSFK